MTRFEGMKIALQRDDSEGDPRVLGAGVASNSAWVLQRTVVSKGRSGWASIGANKVVWSISRTYVLAVTPE